MKKGKMLVGKPRHMEILLKNLDVMQGLPINANDFVGVKGVDDFS